MGRRPIVRNKRRPRGTIVPITTGLKVKARDGESVKSMLLRLRQLGHEENSAQLARRQDKRKINGVNHTLKKGELRNAGK